MHGTSKSKSKKIISRLIKIKVKGELTGVGYGSKDETSVRRAALRRAIKKYGKPVSIYRKLNALYVFNKNKHVTRAQIFKRDRNWIRKTYMK